MACSRCNAGGSCDCFVVAGPGVTITGSGAPATPWVVSGNLTPGSSLDVVFDGVNGSTAPPIVGSNFVICSPGGGGVPGAPSQAAADYPQCPDSGFPKVYQTTAGLKTGPLKKEFSQLLRSLNNQWPNLPSPIVASLDVRAATIHNIVNNECYTLNYFVQLSNHATARVGTIGVNNNAPFYEPLYFLVVNGVRNPIRAGHMAVRPTVTNSGIGGPVNIMDRYAPGQYIAVGALAPAGAMTIQVTRDMSVSVGIGVVDGVMTNQLYDLTIVGVP